MNNQRLLQDIYASRQSGRILTGELSSIENFKQKSGATIPCGIVYYGDIKVYIPVSEMNVSRQDIKVVKSMVGSTIDFVVKELSVQNRVASASRKAAMKIRRSVELPKHKKGDKIWVRITGIGLNHAIVEAFGIETIVTKDYIDWGHLQNISDVLQIGDLKLALIKELDLAKETILVSIKEATEDPYEKNVASVAKGSLELATVTGIKEFGVFFELKCHKGVSALCPFPNWNNFNPQIGDEFLIKIKGIDVKNRKIDGSFSRPVRKNRF